MRFNPFFEGSTNLRVTRVGAEEWWLEATSSDVAWVEARPTAKHRSDPSFEGDFALPFQMNVRLP
jgi:hypothetical protein